MIFVSHFLLISLLSISEHAEADCFFCFTNLMSDIRDFFIKTLDEAESGINGMMLRFYRKIKSMDAKVEARLVDQDIKPQYFSFRYMCIILSMLTINFWESIGIYPTISVKREIILIAYRNSDTVISDIFLI